MHDVKSLGGPGNLQPQNAPALGSSVKKKRQVQHGTVWMLLKIVDVYRRWNYPHLPTVLEMGLGTKLTFCHPNSEAVAPCCSANQ